MKRIKKFESFDDDFTGLEGAKKWQQHLKRMKEDPDYKNAWKENQRKKLKEWWSELKPFEKSTDVPQLPNPLDEFFVNKLIELGAIPKSELKDGHWYYGDFRNSEFGKWDAEKNLFHHIRYKFGYRLDTCNHFQDDDGYALFVPLREANSEELEEINKTLQNI